MKTLALILATLSSTAAMADGEIIQVPPSCYTGAKTAALKYAAATHNNVHAKTPFYAENYKSRNLILVPVFISSIDFDYPARVDVPVRPLKGGGCAIGKPNGL